ncbi:hypothetical protein LAZ67_12001671 [Cordylochernes scorpioides]|uniref:Uncharacterized protein n=1 Tax=Cordylochernes scorpioides TaxID=51811 RepID=A0ABY6L197_9ARAC|nr:hypothetical protein LAZ67_12001671 [Cordylochernes scorpioides]
MQIKANRQTTFEQCMDLFRRIRPILCGDLSPWINHGSTNIRQNLTAVEANGGLNMKLRKDKELKMLKHYASGHQKHDKKKLKNKNTMIFIEGMR